MADSQPLENISLELVCREQGQPFRWLSKGDYTKERTLHSLLGTTPVPFRSAEMYCGRASDVVIFGKSYITDKAGRAVFLNQSHRNYYPQEFVQYYSREILNETAARPVIEQECCFLGGLSAEVRFFGHFIFEYLYRLVAFEMCGVLDRLPVVVYDGVPDSWLTFIELFGIPKDRILRIPQYPAPRFSSVWVASCANFLAVDGRQYAFWDAGIHNLRQRLIVSAAKNKPEGPKRVYLGRKDAVHRKLVNETEVWQFLASRGFQYPDFVGKSAAEQIHAVASADVIVAVTGSGGSMTQFAPYDCSIIDILPPHIVGGLGSIGFAAVIGQTYTRAPTNVAQSDQAVGINSDVEVELETLKLYVDLAIHQQQRRRAALQGGPDWGRLSKMF